MLLPCFCHRRTSKKPGVGNWNGVWLRKYHAHQTAPTTAAQKKTIAASRKPTTWRELFMFAFY